MSSITSSAARETTILQLERAADNRCAGGTYEGGENLDIVPGEWPLVAMSHCHECTASSLTNIARMLAKWGHVVVVPSHEGNTLFDALDGTGKDLQLIPKTRMP